MKTLAWLSLSAAVLVSSSSFAQGLTRSEVHQQLVEAQQNGSEYVSNSSYPDVPPVFQSQADNQRKNASAYGGVAAGSNTGAPRAERGGKPKPETCAGPVHL